MEQEVAAGDPVVGFSVQAVARDPGGVATRLIVGLALERRMWVDSSKDDIAAAGRLETKLQELVLHLRESSTRVSIVASNPDGEYLARETVKEARAQLVEAFVRAGVSAQSLGMVQLRESQLRTTPSEEGPGTFRPIPVIGSTPVRATERAKEMA